jgi:hypothetical protein
MVLSENDYDHDYEVFDDSLKIDGILQILLM